MPKKLSPQGKAAPPPTPESPAPAAKKVTTRRKKAAESAAKAIRNIRHVQCRVTLDDQRILLEPRGQRGDLALVNEDHQRDPWFEPNIGMIYEVISEEEARDILRKQANNQQVGPSTFDLLTNERGEGYAQQTVHVGPSNQEQGQVVAQIDQTGQGRYSQQNETITRVSGEAPQRVEVPGSQRLSEQELDELARRTKGAENTGDVLRSALNVTIEPTQRG